MHLRAAIALSCAAACLPAGAETTRLAAAVQNDFLTGSDGGGLSSGLALGWVRIADANESGIDPPWLLRPLVGWLGMQRSTLAVSSLVQLIYTPSDLSRSVPDPNDVPYLGALMWHSAHVEARHDGADLLSIDLGMIGPASGAAQTQRFIHRVTGSTTPRGWDRQVQNRLLVDVQRDHAWRGTWSAAGLEAASGDWIVIGGGTLGTLVSSVSATGLLRYGRGLDRSVATTLASLGRTGDPFVVGPGWFVYAGLTAQRILHQAGLTGDTPADNEATLRKSQYGATAGFAYGWSGSSLTFALEAASPVVQRSDHRKSYGSITYTLQFR